MEMESRLEHFIMVFWMRTVQVVLYEHIIHLLYFSAHMHTYAQTMKNGLCVCL